jgi:hypothetical protein
VQNSVRRRLHRGLPEEGGLATLVRGPQWGLSQNEEGAWGSSPIGLQRSGWPQGRLVAEGPLLQNWASVAALGGGPLMSRSSSLGEQTHDGALGLPNGAHGASIRCDGEQA